MARELGLDRKTVKRSLAQARPAPYRRTVSRPTVVTPYLEYSCQRAGEVDYNAYRIFHELQERGYAGGYAMVKLAVRPLRAERDCLAEATRRFETAPGRQAQVDWGTTWAQMGTQLVRVQVFVLVLGYSRRLSVELTQDQQLATLIACHEQALDWFGGRTEGVALRPSQHGGADTRPGGAGHRLEPPVLGFRTRLWLHAAAVPTLSGADEGQGGVGGQVRQAQLRPRAPVSPLGGLDPDGGGVGVRVADQRSHGTTFRKPAAAFPEAHLRSHRGRPPYVLQTSLLRTVARDCLVTVETHRYAVPAADVGPCVEVPWGRGRPCRSTIRGRSSRPIPG